MFIGVQTYYTTKRPCTLFIFQKTCKVVLILHYPIKILETPCSVVIDYLLQEIVSRSFLLPIIIFILQEIPNLNLQFALVVLLVLTL